MQGKSRFQFLANLNLLFCVYVVAAIAVSVHRYILGPDDYGNYIIFKNAFSHLLQGKDMYALYPQLNIDLFKYSPTFAVLFCPFALLPDFLGLILWNLLNAIALFFAIKMIGIEENKKAFILWFILIELITSMQNYQSNALTASLILFVFVLLEKKNYLVAGICVAVGFYIKLFGVFGALLWFMYSGKIKFLLSTWASMLLLFAIPLLFVSINELIGIYKSWFNMLASDSPNELNHSVMSVMKNWFGLNLNKIYVQLAGIILLVIPLLRWNLFQEKVFRLLFLCSILIWVVIFNHKAESATYIIAVAGCALWFFNSKQKPLDIVLIALLIMFTCLSPTDLFPKFLRKDYIVPYSLKALPCILIWIKIQYELLSLSWFKQHLYKVIPLKKCNC